jgi:hypothetical protein
MVTTVNGIVEEVDTLLASDDGVSSANRLTKIFRRILDRETDLSVDRKKIRSRRGVAFYLAVGDVREEGIVLDARIWGRKVGDIRLGKQKHRPFTPANFDSAWTKATTPRSAASASPRALEWSDPRVLEYLRDAAAAIEKKVGVNEAVIESAFLAEVRISEKAKKQHRLRHHQPVRLGGFPFQFPLPISARKKASVALGNAAGHSDVLARRSGRRLRVFEVKRPGAPDANHALEQAVTYAATLQRLLESAPDVYYPMLGYSPEHPRLRLEAVALVDEGSLDRVKDSATVLSRENRYFDLYVMVYKLGGTDGRQLIITRDEKVGVREAA